MAKKGKATSDELNALHSLVAQVLAERLKSGECTVGDIQAAIKFLQNNGIEASAEPGTPLYDLKKIPLPDFNDDGDDVSFN